MIAIDNIDRLLELRGRSTSWLVERANKYLPDVEGLRLSDKRFSTWRDKKETTWPKPIHLVAIARALDVPLEILLAEDPNQPLPPERSDLERDLLTDDEKTLLYVVFRGPRAFGLQEAMSRLAAHAPGWQDTTVEGARESEEAAGASEELGRQDLKAGRRVGRPRKPRDPEKPKPKRPLPKMFRPESRGEAAGEPPDGQREPQDPGSRKPQPGDAQPKRKPGANGSGQGKMSR